MSNAKIPLVASFQRKLESRFYRMFEEGLDSRFRGNDIVAVDKELTNAHSVAMVKAFILNLYIIRPKAYWLGRLRKIRYVSAG